MGKIEMKNNKKKSQKWVFLKTFTIAFLIMSALGLGITYGIDKIKNTRMFTGNDGEPVPVLEEELELEELIPNDSPFFKAFTESERANILLLGVNPPLTDVIMLASIDMKNQGVDIISIPRDTYFYRRGYEANAEKKINAAYLGNPVNSAKAVSQVLMGMPINYYAVIDYDGVANIVDSMGGVPMDIPDIQGKGGMYYTDLKDNPPLKIALPAGPRVLNGQEAVHFLRFRHGYPEGDLGRVKAQHQFVKNAISQALSKDILKVAKTSFKNVESDISIGVAVGLASKMTGMKSENVRTYTMPHTTLNEPPWYVYPEEQGIENMIREIYSVKPENVEKDNQSGEKENVEENN